MCYASHFLYYRFGNVVQCSAVQDFIIRQIWQVSCDPTDNKIKKKCYQAYGNYRIDNVTGVAATYFLEGRIHLVDRLLVLLVNDIEFNPAEGLLYISHAEITHRGVVSTVNPANGLIKNIIGGLSSIGVHHNNQFAFGHDGRRYTLLHQQHDLASWMDVSLVVKCRTRLIQWKHPLDIYAYIILIYPFG